MDVIEQDGMKEIETAMMELDPQATDLAAVEKLPEAQKQRVMEIASSIKINDTQAVIQYGTAAQKGIASFSDVLLREIRTKDTGYVGDALTDLMVEIKTVDVDSLLDKETMFKLFGGIKRRVQKFISSYEKVGVNIDKLTANLDKAKMTLLKDIKLLDGMYDRNHEYLGSLDAYILAGKIKLNELNRQVLPELRQKAQQSGDPLDAQSYRDMEQMVNRFEKKIHDLRLSRMIAIQTGPQLRIIQNNNQILAEKIHSSIMNAVPLWKNQIVIAISLFRQEGALKLQEEVSRTTNELLTKNAELLKENSIRVAKESEKGIVEIETLQKVHNSLIETIEETISIQQEGKAKRQEAETALQTIEDDLKSKLIELTK